MCFDIGQPDRKQQKPPSHFWAFSSDKILPSNIFIFTSDSKD